MIQLGGRIHCCVISTSCDLSHGKSLRKVTQDSCGKSDSDRLRQHKVVQVIVTSRKQIEEDGGIWKTESVGKKGEGEADCADVRTNKQNK